MRKYVRPTAEVIELSVKESLSALPGNMELKSVTARTAATQIISTYNLIDSSKDAFGNAKS